MGEFLNHPPQRIVTGRSGDFEHWFGGPPDYRGIVPPGQLHPIHLLYELDLSDPPLGLASRFEHLTKLPLFNALQYNCCDLVYRVVADGAIDIVSMTNPDQPEWLAHHPFDNYPSVFPRSPVNLVPVESEVLGLVLQLLDENGQERVSTSEARSIHRQLDAFGYPFPQVAGRQAMWQGIPDWDCHGRNCKFAGRSSNAGKEVLAVIWERPVPEIHLWSDEPKYRDVGSFQIIFSRCTGCGNLHSCNRCD